jgi:hypothetical protein
MRNRANPSRRDPIAPMVAFDLRDHRHRFLFRWEVTPSPFRRHGGAARPSRRRRGAGQRLHRARRDLNTRRRRALQWPRQETMPNTSSPVLSPKSRRSGKDNAGIEHGDSLRRADRLSRERDATRHQERRFDSTRRPQWESEMSNEDPPMKVSRRRSDSPAIGGGILTIGTVGLPYSSWLGRRRSSWIELTIWRLSCRLARR